MAKGRFPGLWDLFSGGSTMWGLLPTAWQASAAAALSAVTGFLGYQTGGLFYAVLGAAAMFAMVMVAAYYAILLNRQTSVFERLAIEQIAPVQAALTGDWETKEFVIKGYTLEAQIRNHSERSVWIQLRRAQHSMGGQTNDAEISKLVSIIPPHGLQKMNLATLPDIKVIDPLTGTVDLEILYGPQADDLRYVFYYVNKPAIGLLVEEGGKGQLTFTTPITKNQHERV